MDDDIRPGAPADFVHPAQRHSQLGGPRETLLYAVPDTQAQDRVVRALERSGAPGLVVVPLRPGRQRLVAVHCPRTWESMRAVRHCVSAAEPDAEQVVGEPGRIDLTAPEGPWPVGA